MADFNFNELVARANVDYVGLYYPQFRADDASVLVLPSLKQVDQSQVTGRPYFCELTLAYDNVEFTLPNEPLVSFTQAKTIVETATVGTSRVGTVKEYITTEDYLISIRGVCVNDNKDNEYPVDQVALLQQLFAINDALEVVDNPFFELFGVRKLVLKDIQFDEMVGEKGLQRYQINAVSDQDFYADLTEREQGNLNSLL